MKFKFKIQQYQTDAVENTVAVFAGQPSYDTSLLYHRDMGRQQLQQINQDLDDDSGYRNRDIELSSGQLLANIRRVQADSMLPLSEKISTGHGAVALDIEMETGTGKTYVYIKTMFELNRRYGWSKFIIVVPSIAIREGVDKSFCMLEEHFMECYGKKARWFVYNSSNLNQLDQYSSDAGLHVMIVNTQAFAASLKEGGRSKESRIIYDVRDTFASRRPIDVIAANRPIIIMDEPQKMEGTATHAALKKFNPLFTLNYSATHKTRHDTIYSLDALDAYRQRLVKKINVVGFEIKNLRGTSGFMYLDGIELSPTRPPVARLEIEVKSAAGTISRKLKKLNVGDCLIEKSGGLAEYDGYTVSEISPAGYISFANGTMLAQGDVIGDINEEYMQRIQIRETIKVHLQKERQLLRRGIKCLSLFFTDEVAHYRSYDTDGKEVKGKFQIIFEEEYKNLVEEEMRIDDEEYNRYLSSIQTVQTHQGYFSIDKKTGRCIDGRTDKSGISDDISAYDLILKDKERLLSFDEPVRFIFSHSALREGWDNPNVFQICTLRHSDSATAKRQEVGRGLRLCVNKDGIRQDVETLGENIHDINVLTVIANESYASFTDSLQKEIKAAMRERVATASVEFFTGKLIALPDSSSHTTSVNEAVYLMDYLSDNGYADNDGRILPKFTEALTAGSLMPLPSKLQHIAHGAIKLVQAINNPELLKEMLPPTPPVKVTNRINHENFDIKFKQLWDEINHQYVYTVKYDSAELIDKAITHLNAELSVNRLRYMRVEGHQDNEQADMFGGVRTRSEDLTNVSTSTVKYDLLGDIARGTNLTRRTVAHILKGLLPQKSALFRNNPEEFIRKVVRIIHEQKATTIVDHISYKMTEGKYTSDIFTANSIAPYDRALLAKKHITDYVVSDSQGERRFARELDDAEEVVVYAKLPRSFKIPTPVGDYAPDWAIAWSRDGVKHIFFIAETKGTMSDMDISPIEKKKIECCNRLFEDMSGLHVRYHRVSDYQTFIDEMKALR